MIVSMNTLHECALKGMLLQGNHQCLKKTSTNFTFCVISPGLRVLLENPRTPKHIQKREGYSAIKALAAVNNAIIQLMVYGVPSLNRG